MASGSWGGMEAGSNMLYPIQVRHRVKIGASLLLLDCVLRRSMRSTTGASLGARVRAIVRIIRPQAEIDR